MGHPIPPENILPDDRPTRRPVQAADDTSAAEPTSADSQPTDATPSAAKKGGSLRPLLFALLAVLVVAALGAAGFFAYTFLRPDLDKVLASTVQKSSGITSAAFTMKATVTAQGKTVKIVGTGVTDGKRSTRLKGTVEAAGKKLPVEEIVVGKMVYARLGGSKTWVKVPLATANVSQSGPNQPPTDYLKYLSGISKPENLGYETVGGVRCLHLRAPIDSKRLAAMSKGAKPKGKVDPVAQHVQKVLASSKISAELWIDQQRSLPVREIVTMQSSKPTKMTSVIDIEFTAFGVPAKIKAPKNATTLALAKGKAASSK